MKRLLVVPVAALCCLAAAQSRDAFIPYRTLTWADFPTSEPAADPEMIAHTATRVRYDYRFDWRRENGAVTLRVTQWTVVAHFDRAKSWRRGRVTDADTLLLAHEQGHFDISQCTALRQAQLRPDSFTPVSADSLEEAKTQIEKQIQERFDTALAEGDKRQRLYDRETRHGTDRLAQARWSAALTAEVRALSRPGA